MSLYLPKKGEDRNHRNVGVLANLGVMITQKRVELVQCVKSALLVVKGALSVFAGLLLLIVICIVLWKYPAYQVQVYKAEMEEKKPFDKDRAEHDREMFKIENELRGNYAQIIGGFVLLIGLYLTWRKQNHEERTSNQIIRLTEDGKITDRYSKAIELLGSDNKAMRIGGIYALERIARDSEKDHWTVMEALCAFIRHESIQLANAQSEIQVALTVIRRRSWTDKEHKQNLQLDLRKADLSRSELYEADLDKANLEKASLRGANLSGAKLHHAILRSADLSEANLRGAHLRGADLSGTKLTSAELIGADLRAANLTDADLNRADLRFALLSLIYLDSTSLAGANLGGTDLRSSYMSGANLNSADLRGADLSNTNLSYADLSNANLSKAKYDMTTPFPKDYCLESLEPHTDLTNADLSGADLRGANLNGANLNGTDLNGARYDDCTQFPEDFDLARLKTDRNKRTE